MGDELEVDCLIDAYPKPNVYWTKRSLGSASPQSQLPLSFHSRHSSTTLRQLAHLEPRKGQNLAEHRIQIENNKNSLHYKLSIDRPISNPSNAGSKSNRILNTNQEATSMGNNSENNYSDNDRSDYFQMNAQPTTTWLQNNANYAHSAIPSAIKSPISVKHSTIDPYTYKLTMTIKLLKYSDFGVYTCIAINSLGQSDASVIINCKFTSDTYQAA